MNKRYHKSEIFRERALQSITSGAQIFNKTTDYFPLGISPFFAVKAKGAKLWDVDGNEYIDFINASASVILGYCDDEVTSAVQTQLLEGNIFSLSHLLEIQLAEKIIELVPCAERVRFAKNGSDVTSAAIRLARAFTQKNRIAVAGYHGWHDWYIAVTPYNIGIPEQVCDLTHVFRYNDIDSLKDLFKKYPNEFAAIILEPLPLRDQEPKENFLNEVKSLAHQHGVVLIFDEIVSGFRCALGGAQELFKVTPDLVTLGKGLANGFPLAAVAGRADIMSYMEKIFFGSTLSGETLSLAASLATLKKLQEKSVLEAIDTKGNKIMRGLTQLIHQHQLAEVIKLVGYSAQPALKYMQIENYTALHIRNFLMQELHLRGILCFGVHNMCYAHSEEEIAYLLNVYDEVFYLLSEALKHKNLSQYLISLPQTPYFQIRKYKND